MYGFLCPRDKINEWPFREVVGWSGRTVFILRFIDCLVYTFLSVLPTLILVTSMLFVKILRAHTPACVNLDIRGMEQHVMVKQY